jgi:sugar lactone lactonase YvrE
MTPHDTRICTLGEGPLWHPERAALFWFDINNKKLLSQTADGLVEWQFDEHVSAAGWVDHDTLIMASESGLYRFDLTSGERTLICALDADNPVTRSNDGRADPWGGFWIGTMGKQAEENAGALYRYYRGELRTIVPTLTISNAICFAPDRSCAYYTDTPTQQIMRFALEPDTGWPTGNSTLHLDLSKKNMRPDGAVTDAQGNLWIALFGGARVVCFAPDGTQLREVPLPAANTTCPAFGGPEMRDLYVTSATIKLTEADIAERPQSGMTFHVPDVAQGVAEPQVLL